MKAALPARGKSNPVLLTGFRAAAAVATDGNRLSIVGSKSVPMISCEHFLAELYSNDYPVLSSRDYECHSSVARRTVG